MKSTRINILLGVLVWQSGACGAVDADELPQLSAADAGFNAEKLAEIDGVVATAILAKKLPGCVVLVGRPQGVVWLKAYGHKRILPEPTPMTDDTLFDLASLTKPLATATAVMKLVETGKLALDDPVAKHLPEFGVEEKQAVTLCDLLVHRSGLIPDNPLSDYADGPIKAKERVLALKLIAPTGDKFIYSDVNFMVLGQVVEHVSGQSLNEFAGKNIFTPTGMIETTFLPPKPLRDRAAPTEQRAGHWMQGEVHDPRAYELGGVAGHAGVFGTARDLARYAMDALAGIEHDRSRILKRETWRMMTTPHTIAGVDRQGKPTRDVRGLGWDMQSRYSSSRATIFSQTAFGHNGFTGTSIWIDPERRLYVIFLSNRVHPDGQGQMNPLAREIAEIAIAAIHE